MSSLHYVTRQVVEVMPPEVENVVDTTGAGDAFLGGLIVGKCGQCFVQEGVRRRKSEFCP